MIDRRALLLLPLATAFPRVPSAQSSPGGQMLLSMHQNTSAAAGYRGSLEGWARAGIRYVELSDRLLDAFLENDALAAAARVLSDSGLTPVSAAAVLPDIWIPGPDRAASLETWRRRCDQFIELGSDKIYAPSITRRNLTAEDFAAAPEAIHEVGEITSARGLTAMIEFTRTSTHLATLPTMLSAIREAGHSTVRPMLDFFHFVSGLSRLEDLSLLEPGELAHAHFQDLAPGPRELIDNDSRLIPGDGIAPVDEIIRTLAQKGYSGALSVELFRADIVNADPYEMASEIREKCETVMRTAGVL
ncbi:MAG TPA: sugar phosphate isomerase/epimerase [Gammaproteobacteria bacterium]